jgi:hypothetical protein
VLVRPADRLRRPGCGRMVGQLDRARPGTHLRGSHSAALRRPGPGDRALAETERIRGELGIADEPAYRAALAADPGMYAASPAGVERIFQAHIDRVLPELPRYFSRLPTAPFRLRPLNAELSGMTYGYHQPPAGTGAGYYHYNASNLPGRPLLQAASVIYHEGLPGHHLQMGLLAENTALHPIRREQTQLRTFALTGYLEGWAEYAAGLCDQIGMYTDPRDRYGRMTPERFAAARMVADTGLNVLGCLWARQRPACVRAASCPSLRSPAKCCATRSMIFGAGFVFSQARAMIGLSSCAARRARYLGLGLSAKLSMLRRACRDRGRGTRARCCNSSPRETRAL